MVGKWVITFVAVLVICAPCGADDRDITDDEVGLAYRLPADDWKLQDLSQAGVVAHLYSPPGTMVPRVTVMRFPKAFLPRGLKTRAAQVLGTPGVKQVRLEASELAGVTGHVFEYTGQGVRTVEYGLEKGGHVFVIQLAAMEADWRDDAKAQTHADFFASVRFTDAPTPEVTLRVDPKTPAQVRAAREAAKPSSWPFAIRSHDLKLDLWPEAKRLRVVDDLVVEANVDNLTNLDLLCTHVEVTSIGAGDTPLAFRRKNDRVVAATLAKPLAKGETLALRFEAEADPYTFHMDQKLVAEISMLGQVNATSSFSSHVLYYPIDPVNDATVTMAITVPEGYTAVSGGTFIGEDQDDEYVTFHYALGERVPRLLPTGFAVGRYEQVRGTTPGGLEVVVHHPDGKTKEAKQRLDVALSSGALFEKRMGPLPWTRVALCHVTPERKEMGVALPGLILISDGFFQDVEGVELSGEALNDPAMMGLLLPADELSHQWNGYATALPNELAEGVSTFTNLLFVESQAGAGEYAKGMAFCAQAYMASAVAMEDVAVADPKLYRSDIYRVVAFCKVAVVLDLLRKQLGDEVFFRAWFAAFTTLRGKRLDFDDFERALATEAKTDLRPFFEQWFFQAGHPRLEIGWRCATDRDRPVLVIDVEQTQPGGLFTLDVPIDAVHADGTTTRLTIDVSKKKQTLRLPIPTDATDIRVDPDQTRRLLHADVENRR